MSEGMKRPSAQRDQLATLWDRVIGNGRRGMVDDVADMKVDIAFIKGKVEGHVGAPSRKTIALRKIAETAVVALVFGIVLIGGVMFVSGRLDADDIANILRAWKGSP